MSDEVVQAVADFFARDPHGAYAAYLFGSVARGTARASSDVDVAVLLESGRPTTLEAYPTALRADLSALLGREVDLVVLDSAPPDLTHRVLRDGKIVLDRDRRRRIAFEVRARNQYFDMRPILDRYRGAHGKIA
jgi:predicted nucleotidyltransferase